MRRLATFLLVLLAAGIGAAWYFWPGDPPARYDTAHQPLPHVPPGTVIGDGPPEGWSHLVVKSHPKPGSGDLHRIPSVALPLTKLLFTATLADVEAYRSAGRQRYRLGKVAVGLGTSIRGRDTIITPDTQAELGANFGVFSRLVLARSYAKLQEVVSVVRSDTMLLMDASAFMLRDGRHRPVILRHALLVGPRTGSLDTLVWCIGLDGENRYGSMFGAVQLLPPGLVEQPVLHVDGREFNSLGLPSDIAFAMPGMPPGEKQYEVPPGLRELCEKATLTAEEAERLEKGLRELK